MTALAIYASDIQKYIKNIQFVLTQEDLTLAWASGQVLISIHVNGYYMCIYHIDTDEIPGFFLLLKNHIFIVRSEDTIFIFYV